MKKCISIVTTLLLFIIFSNQTFAESNYVLPYPGTMPGSKWYQVHLIWEKAMRHWYFGDFGKFNYALKESDKYLVEAKTLFEYRQYLLGYKALEKSDSFFVSALPNLLVAQKKGKNITEKRFILNAASAKHIEVLEQIESRLPETFIWQDEKSAPIKLDFKQRIDQAKSVRTKSI